MTSYHLERKGPNDSDYVEIAGNISGTSYSDTHVQAGVSYSYRVR